MIPCQAHGHHDVPAAESPTGFQLPFCAPHFDALPTRLRRTILEVSEASPYETNLHKAALETIAKGRAYLKALKRNFRGICRQCGCTEEAACEGGCRWIDRAQTLCSACSERP